MESLPQKSPPIAPRSVVSTKVSKPLYTPVVGYGPSFVPYGSMLSLNSLILGFYLGTFSFAFPVTFSLFLKFF
ncbi:Oidioi.mRNA.OKI2018_I69.chr1.g1102.t2.cds [Oikopleura dioica]|uniref:Oidioi.mRNA.OKI2018_I69.chr1.g1102.t2.cds n=1 Tax=Oikopleura dioica TaxID=34765 RepID=A0ABN7SLX6_OIKDI|nr:Oidioi.mRNA.OKI2018_I69.chr1.g1102.t2.cds [Oikopleura dioica]